MSNDKPTDATGVPLTLEAEQAVRHDRIAREILDEAYRARAWRIAVLGSCVCAYPVGVDDRTASGHDPRCPAEAMERYERERKSRVAK